MAKREILGLLDRRQRLTRPSDRFEGLALGHRVMFDRQGRLSFQLLQGFDMGQELPPIIYYAFHLLRLNGKDLRNLPIEERKSKFEELLKKPPGVIRYSVSFTKDIPELLDRTQKLGLEGLNARCRLLTIRSCHPWSCFRVLASLRLWWPASAITVLILGNNTLNPPSSN